jgi:hypothetical protein
MSASVSRRQYSRSARRSAASSSANSIAPAREPHQRCRRRAAVGDTLEVVVSDRRGEDRRDPLDRERTRELGMVRVVAHDRQEVDQPRLHRLDLGRAVRQRGGKLGEPAGFEGRPHQDGTVGLAQRVQQRVRERRPRVRPRVGEELVVGYPTLRVGPVERPLERHLLVRPRAGIERDRQEGGLEVEAVGGRARADKAGISPSPYEPFARRVYQPAGLP